jgi:NitT/TauT family transport system substrate-binding protein
LPSSSSRRHPPRGARTATRVVLAVAAILALVAVTGCGSGSGEGSSATSVDPAALPTTDPVAVRLGYFPNVTHAPALVGVQRDLFGAELAGLGATVETKTFNAGPEALESLLSGALDITYIGPNPAVNAYQKTDGDAVRIVAGSTSGGAKFVVAPDISTAEDLRGKTVASPQLGGTQDIALRHWLGQQGLDTDTTGGGDVSVKPQANADTLAAFRDGQIAGAWVPAPWDTRLVEEGGGKVLVDEATLWPDGQFTTTVILVRKAFLDEHPAAVNAILAAHLEALAAIEADPATSQADANAAIDAATGKPLSAELIAAAWQGLRFTPDPLPATVKRSAEDAVGLGLAEPTDLGPLFDLTLLDALLATVGRPTVERS